MPSLPNQANSSKLHTPQLDSLTSIRGVAAWWVVLYHFGLYIKPYVSAPIFKIIDSGYLAVDLFFCLSGFVIFMNYGAIDFKKSGACKIFYIKRLAKIYPLHLLIIGFYICLVGLLAVTHRPIPDSYSIRSLLYNLFLVQDWNLQTDLSSWNIPSWSISAEFAAYLLFPVLAFIVRPASRHIWYGGFLVLGALIALNLSYAPEEYDLGRAITTFGVIRCVTQFTIGAVLAGIFLRYPSPRRIVQLTLLVAAASLFVVGLHAWQSIFIPLGWGALVLYVAYNDKASRLLRLRPLIFIGEISYATYMVHYFVRELFKLTLVHKDQVVPAPYLGLTFLVIAAISVILYQFVEKPAQRWSIKMALPKQGQAIPDENADSNRPFWKQNRQASSVPEQ
jgi:peptidoglycan/LPS O-acetylase OafA/YrhL